VQILSKLIKYPNNIQQNTLATYKKRMEGSPYFLAISLEEIIAKEMGIDVRGKIRIEISPANPFEGNYMIDTNLSSDFKIDEKIAYGW